MRFSQFPREKKTKKKIKKIKKKTEHTAAEKKLVSLDFAPHTFSLSLILSLSLSLCLDSSFAEEIVRRALFF